VEGSPITSVAATARRLLADFDSASVTESGEAWSEAEAYAIASELDRMRAARGERLVGFKVGCTSPTIQKQVGIDNPVFGRLYDTGVWHTGVSLNGGRFSGPAIEGELAVKLCADLGIDDTSDDTLMRAIGSTIPVIELHHGAFMATVTTTGHAAPRLIANNAVHAGFVEGAGKSGFSLASGKLTISVVEPEHEAAEPRFIDAVGPEITRVVLDSLAWLTKRLQHDNLRPLAGQTILCGSVPPMLPVTTPCEVHVDAGDLGTVACSLL
jgi:2-keto-4-pentenoate hydratase